MGLRLFFLPNFPGATFIQGGTFIPDSRVHSQFQLVRILLHSNPTSTNFIPIALKFVLVEIVLVETVLVGDPLY